MLGKFWKVKKANKFSNSPRISTCTSPGMWLCLQVKELLAEKGECGLPSQADLRSNLSPFLEPDWLNFISSGYGRAVLPQN